MHLALGVEYDGSAFHGFQLQKAAATVQGALEQALSRIADHPLRIAAAGRTDAGVHATGQVVGFASSAERPIQAWVKGVNALTPPSVKVRWAREVDPRFHPRYSATARRYMYLWYEDDVTSPTLDRWAVRVRHLDDDAMHAASRSLVGEHDFSAFRASGCQSESAHRCVHRITVHRHGPLVVLDIAANAFLLHMVRNIAAALRDVGEGRRPAGWLAETLAGRDRKHVGPTAPAHGLYLVGVRYPDQAFPPGEPPPLLRSLGGLARV
jgi:tRNA pseudouridine38-40 synthase